MIGGLVYRGRGLPQLAGHYLYADFCSGQVYGFPVEDADAEETLLAVAGFRISAFSRDRQGEILLLNLDGEAGSGIYRLREGGQRTAELPAQLSGLDCFTDTAHQQVSVGGWSYQLALAAWNNGMQAQYYASLPSGKGLLPGFGGDLIFPARAVLIKNLYRDGRIEETQLLMHHLSGWAGYTYAWNAQATDATLVPAEGARIRGRDYMSRGQCDACHINAARNVLGADLAQFSSVQLSPGQSQLDVMNQRQLVGLFNYIPAHFRDPLIHPIGAGSLSQQARSYLHVNCSGCHRPNGAAVAMDLRITTAWEDTGLCERLEPGHGEGSLLYQRMRASGVFRMPPALGLRSDEVGIELIRRWIDGMKGCGEIK